MGISEENQRGIVENKLPKNDLKRVYTCLCVCVCEQPFYLSCIWQHNMELRIKILRSNFLTGFTVSNGYLG